MKRALVLSGGGCKGAFEVGAVDYLVNKLGMGFKIFLGTSAGALNVSILGQACNHQELTARTRQLKNIWLNIKGNETIYHKNAFGLIRLLFNDSLYRPDGLKQLLRQHINLDLLFNPISVVKVTTVALETGELFYADSRNHKIKNDYLDYILASASIPVYFPPVKINEKHWYDGGLRDMTPSGAVFQENPTEIMVIITYPIDSDFHPILRKTEYSGAIKALQRVLEILTSEIAANDLQLADAVNRYQWCIPGKRHIPIRIIAPRSPLHGNGLLDFDPVAIRKNIELGYEAAQNPYIILPGNNKQVLGKPINV